MKFISRKSATPEVVALAKILGYKKMPPDIVEFIEDPYYLGKSVELFPFWKEKLKEIYPSPVHTAHPIVSLNCAIGSGKSTVTKIMELYMECRLDHLGDLSILGIGKYLTKPICSYFFHTSNEKARSEFVHSLAMMKESSAYFQNMVTPGRWLEYVCDSTKTNSAIGRDIIFFAFSEVNFTDYHKTYEKINSGMGRFNARFITAMRYFGNIVLDSSPSTTSSVSNDFIKKNPNLNIFTVYAPIWEAHKHKNFYFKEGSIQVYLGDSNYDPFVIDPESPLRPEMDQDLVITVPKELESEFRADIFKAIRDKAGLSLDSMGSFFKSKDKLLSVFKLPMYLKDEITYDMYDSEDRLMDHLQTAINMSLPRDKTLFIRLDLGVVNDKTGLSIGYLDGYHYPNPGDKKTKLPLYKVPLSVAISRYNGQETSITKITEFILQLSKDYSIGSVSADSFQSRQMLQDLKIQGIKVNYISVDKTTTAYNYLKNVIYNGHIEVCSNKLLMEELKNLQFTGSKVDHLADGCFTADTLILTRVNDNCQLTPLLEIVKDKSKYEILSYDIPSKSYYWNLVKSAWHSKSVTELVELHFRDGSIYTCTLDHKFLWKDEYIPAVELPVKKFILEVPLTPVYDLEVYGPNPNFCLSNGQVVHNSKDVADSLSGLVLDIFNNLEIAETPSTYNLKEKTMNLIDELNANKKVDPKKYEKEFLNNYLSQIF